MERCKTRLHRGWRFARFADGVCPSEVYTPAFDDSSWEEVRVPHDWAAAGTFERENDISYQEVIQDGIRTPIAHTGRTGALPMVGRGIYRKWIKIDEADRGKAITLEFDGVMWESRIYVNGKQAHFSHFGYKSFSVDISEYVNYGEDNLIAVEAEVFANCSRWYPGAGMYRNAYLVKKNARHIKYNGVWLRQVQIENDRAIFELALDHVGEDVSFKAEIIAPCGKKVADIAHSIYYGELSEIFMLENIELWDIENPALYTANITLLSEDGEALDNESVRFGIRSVEFTRDGGFFLNGRHTKINGVCNHHDLGSLGAAVNVAALRRQLRIMREMGVNSIRTSHNPPSPELLDLCDELGFLVMDEFFDEWYIPKIANGYAKYFREHAIEDATDIIKRDRNHPSVILWSIGNEINEQGDKEGWRAARNLVDLCHRVDPTRPVTAGIDRPWDAFPNLFAHFLDVVGTNYKPHMYDDFRREHPWIKLLGAETASCVSTRGVYHLPAEIAIPCKEHDDLTVSAYDMEAPGWACYAEREFAFQDDCPFVAGEYVWTGFDYLGEPTPYYSAWPSRSSYFGAVDMCGLPKNRFWGYKARWTNEPVLHIFPHWNWEGHEGETVPVHAYASTEEAELLVNGKSYGKQRLGVRTGGDLGQIERYRFMWNDVVYEPGEVKVVAYDENGNAVMEKSVFTAGEPHHIVLSADREVIASDGEDLVYVTASVVDENGNVCPHCDARIFFTAEGAEVLTTDNGDPREVESFARPDKKCLSGMVVACVRSIEGLTGKMTLTATGEGLICASVTVDVK